MLLARSILRLTNCPPRVHKTVQKLHSRSALLYPPRMTDTAGAVQSAPVPAAVGSKTTDPPEPEVYSDRWEQLWGVGLARGERWDASAASPALVDLLKSGKVDVKGARVLVPGCGRGYDLPVFRSAGASEVVGLELAPTAAREARAYLEEIAAGPGPAAEGMRVEEGNFFEWSDASCGDGSWDVGFDYTFGCAMHPTDRQQWADNWGRHVRSGGTLVTLVFPVNPDADPNTGPPFPVSPDLYRQLLEVKDFEVTYEAVVPAELSHPPRVGREVMMVWRKK